MSNLETNASFFRAFFFLNTTEINFKMQWLIFLKDETMYFYFYAALWNK